MVSGIAPFQAFGKGDDLVRGFPLRMDQQEIGAGLGIGGAAPQRLVEPEIGDQRLGAGDHEQVVARSGGARRFDLALELLRRAPAPAGRRQAGGVLREGLVLDHDSRRPGARIGADDMEDIDRVAVAGIEIGDERDLDLLDDGAGHVEMLA